jgi:NTP pyrophosphatase (non-canonical NTP hydrolase)
MVKEKRLRGNKFYFRKNSIREFITIEEIIEFKKELASGEYIIKVCRKFGITYGMYRTIEKERFLDLYFVDYEVTKAAENSFSKRDNDITEEELLEFPNYTWENLSEKEKQFYNNYEMKEKINELVKEIHSKNVEAGWWNDPETNESLLNQHYTQYVIASKLLLVHTELSEATEGYRKDLMDDKLPHRSMIEVELADALIRIFDVAGALNLDLGGAIEEKRNFNSTRSDHKVENRVKKGGKKF